jgi:hypothetical protein
MWPKAPLANDSDACNCYDLIGVDYQLDAPMSGGVTIYTHLKNYFVADYTAEIVIDAT